MDRSHAVIANLAECAAGGHQPAGVLLFGGSFDPPTRAHAMVADRVRVLLFGPRGLLILVPASRSPHKDAAPGADDATRVAMLSAVSAGLDPARVWTAELDRGGASYWVDTLVAARQQLGDEIPIRFLIGADQVINFHLWHDAEQVAALAEPAVVLRPPITTRTALRRALEATEAWDEPQVARWMSRVVEAPMLDASATQARALIAERAPRAAIEALVLPEVRELAEASGCYRESGDSASGQG